MKRLLCWIVGHGSETLHEDNEGAAWITCDRCNVVIASHTWHGGKPWENDKVD